CDLLPAEQAREQVVEAPPVPRKQAEGTSIALHQDSPAARSQSHPRHRHARSDSAQALCSLNVLLATFPEHRSGLLFVLVARVEARFTDLVTMARDEPPQGKRAAQGETEGPNGKNRVGRRAVEEARFTQRSQRRDEDHTHPPGGVALAVVIVCHRDLLGCSQRQERRSRRQIALPATASKARAAAPRRKAAA